MLDFFKKILGLKKSDKESWSPKAEKPKQKKRPKTILSRKQRQARILNKIGTQSRLANQKML